MLELTTGTFDQEATRASSPILVDFWAPWCAPCRVMGPILDEVSGEMPEVRFAKVNVDDHPDLAMRFNVLSIPTFIVFKGGSEVARFSRAMSKEAFKETLMNIL